MSFIEDIKARARSVEKTIILPEAQDPRVLQAAQLIASQKIARIKLLATPEELDSNLEGDLDDSLIEVIDYKNSDLQGRLAEGFKTKRAHKGVTAEQAVDQMGDRLYFASMMVAEGLADGMVAGSIATTGALLRAAFQCIGTSDGIKTGSSSFAMELLNPSPAGDSVLFYADCAVNPDPDPDQLCDIALATAQTYRALVGEQPRVAFLSFSTKGSASHPLVKKTSQAVDITRREIEKRGLDIVMDGEMQADAALVPAVADAKCPESPIQGRANILIFPDLQAGNIAYKLTQRIAGAGAYGPIMQGLAKPANDLSRGCSAEDIVGVAAITACQ